MISILLVVFIALNGIVAEIVCSNRDGGGDNNCSLYTKYDAILIPGGGLDSNGQPHPWVLARLDKALEREAEAHYLVVLSRGTTHKPPPVDGVSGFPIDEAEASATYLMSRGIAKCRILLDTWSLDTIGNAYFALTAVCGPLQLKRNLIITSDFHLPRAKSIFEWVFGMDKGQEYWLDFDGAKDVGLSQEQLESRKSKEANALISFAALKQNIGDFPSLARFVLVEHAAYNSVSQTTKQKQATTTTTTTKTLLQSTY